MVLVTLVSLRVVIKCWDSIFSVIVHLALLALRCTLLADVFDPLIMYQDYCHQFVLVPECPGKLLLGGRLGNHF